MTRGSESPINNKRQCLARRNKGHQQEPGKGAREKKGRKETQGEKTRGGGRETVLISLGWRIDPGKGERKEDT